MMRHTTTRIRLMIALGGLVLAGVARAETPQEAARRAMEASAARQKAAVAAMLLSIGKQRAALEAAAIERRGGEVAVQPAAESYFTLSWPAMSADCDPMPGPEIAPLIQEAARKEELDEGLLRAVAEQESAMRACVVSPQGAMGIMQLMPSTARELGVRDPFDPRENLLSGAHFLKQLLTRFGGDPALALAAYNAGQARVEADGGIPQIPETLHYVQQILSRLPIP
jgi:soluble lytic murein transglycosylase-like protein